MEQTYLIIFLISTLAFALSAICGGGASMILIPLMGRFVSVRQVPAALSVGTFTSSATRLWVFRKHISWKIVQWFVPPAIPAVWLGAWLLKFVNPVYLEMGIALFLISNIIPVKGVKDEQPASHVQLVVIGFLAGFLSGLTGAVGLLFNKFYLRHGLKKEEIVATRAANEIILHLIKIVLYTFFGLLTREVLGIGLVIAVAAVLSTWLTKYVLPYLSERVFRKIGYTAMVLSGVMMLQQALSHQAFTFEYSYGDGFEFEQVIPFAELSAQQQAIVKRKNTRADRIVIEVVYSFRNRSYEAYYYDHNRLIEKYSFE